MMEEMVVGGLILLFFVFLLYAGLYIFTTVAFYKLAGVTGYEKKWVAFIPGFNFLILADYMNDKVGGFLKGRLNMWFVYIPMIVGFLFGFLSGSMGAFGSTDGGLLIVNAILFLSLVFVGVIAIYVSLKFAYRQMDNNKALWAVLVILLGNVGLYITIFAFVSQEKKKMRNKESQDVSEVSYKEEDFWYGEDARKEEVDVVEEKEDEEENFEVEEDKEKDKEDIDRK